MGQSPREITECISDRWAMFRVQLSPFRPFVLASTSVGQEGLDFHTWCHRVVHWNLPSNPVDLEQREGRIHRYKGHAVRKNIAERFGLRSLLEWDNKGDPWVFMFDRAVEARAPGMNDIVPYWVCLLYTSPSPRDGLLSRMPSSA